MNTILLLAGTALIANPVETGDLLTYRGEIVAKRGNPVETRKTFALSLVIEQVRVDGAVAFWTVTEKGQGSWPWPQHFGRLQFDKQWRVAAESLPSVLYQHEAGSSPVPISPPVFSRRIEASGDTWTHGGLDFQVAAAEKIKDVDCWKIEARNEYGTKRVLWSDKSGPLVMAMAETVFLGAGKEHALRYELADRRKLTQAELAAATAEFTQLESLRSKLGYKPHSQEANWSSEQLAVINETIDLDAHRRDVLPSVKELFGEVMSDYKTSTQRWRSLTAHRDKLTAERIGQLRLQTLKEEHATIKELLGTVTVLHFWEYRDAPLQQPYGQSGYLDYLFRQHKTDDIRIYGVNADPRLADPATRRAAIVAAKKLKSFMNLSYPLLLDRGDTIRAFGDPRATDAKLPLFIVLDRTGAVIHHHVGHYEVDRNTGLKELNEVIQQASQKDE